ncbi:nucleotidyltransferase family protein [Zavarzinia sp. CC-PAN008]|uniref:nucleotidyltransferase family protein n=1 Tax=Zavarzinia sp. CC-PAN008 TaxID=3243332 RepID=UPI003F7431EF
MSDQATAEMGAMILAAGLGTRMRPLTETVPKALVQVAGRTLLDRALDRVAEAGLGRAVVNVHYLAEQVRSHLAGRVGRPPEVVISDETERLLETGGALRQALPLLAGDAILVLNVDAMWRDGMRHTVRSFIQRWDPAQMDVLLLAVPAPLAVGYEGQGDYLMAPDGRLKRRPETTVAPFVYGGLALLKRTLVEARPPGHFGLARVFDEAEANGRLFGQRFEGQWMHVGTPAGVRAAEAVLAEAW